MLHRREQKNHPVEHQHIMQPQPDNQGLLAGIRYLLIWQLPQVKNHHKPLRRILPLAKQLQVLATPK